MFFLTVFFIFLHSISCLLSSVSSHPRLVQLSAGPAGLLETDGAIDPTTHGAETAIRRPGVGQEDRQINTQTRGRMDGQMGLQTHCNRAGSTHTHTNTHTFDSCFCASCFFATRRTFKESVCVINQRRVRAVVCILTSFDRRRGKHHEMTTL